MDLTHFTPRLADDLTVVVDGAETIQIYQPDSGSLLTVSNCVGQTIKANKTPSESPQGAVVLERVWNAPLEQLGVRNEELGREAARAAGQGYASNPAREAAQAVGQGYASKPAFSALPTSNQEPTLSAAQPTSNQEPTLSAQAPSAPHSSLLTPHSDIQRVAINDIIIDSHDQQWRIVSIERKERLGRVVYKTQRIDDRPRLDEWVDIITPIYQTDDNGAPYVYKYRVDLAGVSVRIIRVPVSSHRQLIDVPEERIEIVFADNNLRIGAHHRIRLSDGTIYKPTDLFPITQTRPALRIIAQREAVGSRP